MYFILSCPVQHICVVTKRGREPRSAFLSIQPCCSVTEECRISSYASRKQLLSTQTKLWGMKLRKLSCVLKGCVKMCEIQFSRLNKVLVHFCLYQRWEIWGGYLAAWPQFHEHVKDEGTEAVLSNDHKLWCIVNPICIQTRAHCAMQCQLKLWQVSLWILWILMVHLLNKFCEWQKICSCTFCFDNGIWELRFKDWKKNLFVLFVTPF